MHQGVINSFQSHHRRLVNRYLATTENKEDVTSMKINIEDTISIITITWKDVTNGTISNCFRKAGLVTEEIPQDVQQTQEKKVTEIYEALLRNTLI